MGWKMGGCGQGSEGDARCGRAGGGCGQGGREMVKGEMGDGRWEMGDGRWEMGGVGWKKGNGRGGVEEGECVGRAGGEDVGRQGGRWEMWQGEGCGREMVRW